MSCFVLQKLGRLYITKPSKYTAHTCKTFMAAGGIARQVKFGDFVADFDSFELRKHGIRLKLQHQPFQILRLMLQRPGQLVTREELRMELWTESTFVDFDAGLNAAIRRLRDALNDVADEPRL